MFFVAGDIYRNGSAEGLRRARERVRREVELLDRRRPRPRTARSSSPRSRPSTTRQRSGPSASKPRDVAPGRRRPTSVALKRPLAHREHDLLALRPPEAEHAVELGRHRGRRLPRAAASRGSASSAAAARSNASARGPAPALVLVSTAAPVRSPRWTRRPARNPGHRAAVAGEDAVAAAVELEPEPPAEAPAHLVDHRLQAAPSGRAPPSAARRRSRRRGTFPSGRDRRRSTTATPPRPSTRSPPDPARRARCRRTGST